MTWRSLKEGAVPTLYVRSYTILLDLTFHIISEMSVSIIPVLGRKAAWRVRDVTLAESLTWVGMA